MHPTTLSDIDYPPLFTHRRDARIFACSCDSYRYFELFLRDLHIKKIWRQSVDDNEACGRARSMPVEAAYPKRFVARPITDQTADHAFIENARNPDQSLTYATLSSTTLHRTYPFRTEHLQRQILKTRSIEFSSESLKRFAMVCDNRGDPFCH